MIHDKLENLIRYIPAGKRAAVQNFLKKLSEYMKEGISVYPREFLIQRTRFDTVLSVIAEREEIFHRESP